MAKRTILAIAGGLAFVAQSQAAFAQDCISEAEVSAMTIYSVPPVISGIQAKCSAILPADGFLATEGAALSARYAALAPQTWPIARDVLLEFAGHAALSPEEREMFETLRQLPDSAIRPVVDELIAQKLAETIKPESCGKIERGMSLLAPLEPEEIGAMTAFVLSLTKPDELPICDTLQP